MDLDKVVVGVVRETCAQMARFDPNILVLIAKFVEPLSKWNVEIGFADSWFFGGEPNGPTFDDFSKFCNRSSPPPVTDSVTVTPMDVDSDTDL